MSFRAIVPTVLSAMLFAACADDDAISGPHLDRFAVAFALDAGATCGATLMPADQCAALVAIYNAMDGASWTPHNDWAAEPDPCAWEGVFCNEDATVRWLHLHESQVTGAIPGAIGNLVDLEALILFDNQITGPIPPELGNLPKLVAINAWGNQLSGPIPVELANLASLEVLALAENELDGSIPAELATMPSLVYLRLEDNHLSGEIPAAFGSAPALAHLNLRGNNLEGPIPPELGASPTLRLLALNHNQLSGPVPSALADLPSLGYLYLTGNALEGLLPLPVAELGDAIDCRIGPEIWDGNEGVYMPDVDAYRAWDIDGDGFICGIPFSSAEDIGEDAVEDVDELVPDPLNEGQATALTTKIQNAIDKAANGQYRAAINQMEAFIAQVTDMVANGTLTSAEAAALIEQAESLIAIWSELL
jgi:hypothetical protein